MGGKKKKKAVALLPKIGVHLISCKSLVVKDRVWLMGLIRAICLTSAPSYNELIN